MPLKVVITDYEYPNIDTERQIISDAGYSLADYQLSGEQELMDATADADAVIVQYATITRKVIENLRHCQMIIKYGIGINNIDVAAASEQGIWVCNVPDYGLDEVSNHAVAMMLALGRQLLPADRALHQGKWGNETFRPLYRLAELTLGIVGYGALGQMVAKKMAGFGMNTLAYDPIVEKCPPMDAQPVHFVSLEELCSRSDFITIHCPLNRHTENMINSAMFEVMKPSAYLVNTARGGIINQADLVQALREKKIAGGGLDVYEKEPLDRDSPLLSLPNVILTGHVAWYSEQSIAALQRKAAEEVVNVLGGNAPFHPCNTPKGKA